MTNKHNKNKKWIQHAINKKHEGSLRRWAKMHGFINKDDTIDLQRAYAYAKRKRDTHRIRQINLAKNLKRFKK